MCVLIDITTKYGVLELKRINMVAWWVCGHGNNGWGVELCSVYMFFVFQGVNRGYGDNK